MSNTKAKISNEMLNNLLSKLAKITKRKYYVNMFITDQGTKYGITRINKDKTQEIVVTTEHNKRELFGMINGYLLLRSEEIVKKVKK